jgi:hypothetical protein
MRRGRPGLPVLSYRHTTRILITVCTVYASHGIARVGESSSACARGDVTPDVTYGDSAAMFSEFGFGDASRFSTVKFCSDLIFH